MHSIKRYEIGSITYLFWYVLDLDTWSWALTTTLSISTLLKNTLSKVSFSNLLTNNFLDHPKASEDFFYTFGVYTFKNYTFESVVVSAHAL